MTELSIEMDDSTGRQHQHSKAGLDCHSSGTENMDKTAAIFAVAY